MPPTREQIEAAMAKLPEDQREGFLAEVQRRLGNMTPSPHVAPTRGASLGDFMAWRQGAMGDLGRAEPQTPEEVGAAGRGAVAGLASSGAIAAPVAALKMAGGAAGSLLVDQAVDKGLQTVGVPSWYADMAGDVAGVVVGGVGAKSAGGTLLSLIRRGGKPAAREVLSEVAEKSAQKIFPKTEAEALRASALLRQAGKTQREIDALIAPIEKATAKALPKVEQKAAQEAAKTVSPGAVRAAQQRRFVSFARQEAKGHKFGEKVWMELNEAGEPIRVMTPGQASAVPASMKTWIKKRWSN